MKRAPVSLVGKLSEIPYQIIIPTIFILGMLIETASSKSMKVSGSDVFFHPAKFSDLPGWHLDDHKAAIETFRRSCRKLSANKFTSASSGGLKRSGQLGMACMAMDRFSRPPDRHIARKFFESYFVPHKVSASGHKGLLTGYYEPVLQGSRTQTSSFNIPVYKRPNDLVDLSSRTVSDDSLKGLIAARQTTSGLTPYPTRAEINQGALKELNLEILYLSDVVDLYFLQVQGSGRIQLTDGTEIRIGYDGRNGYPYTSIGKIMILRRIIPETGMSLESVKNWLQSNVEQARELMWQNKSYIFFRELKSSESSQGPLGAMSVALTPGRSLAVDTRYHKLGLPIYVVSPEIRHHGENGFRRLMVAQDVGSGIKGPERGDIYWGSGHRAGQIAGITMAKVNYFVLFPKVVGKIRLK